MTLTLSTLPKYPQALVATALLMSAAACVPQNQPPMSTTATPASAEAWLQAGRQTVEQNERYAHQAHQSLQRPAKNVILFIGDGMGISTVTAARIFAGQSQNQSGEEYQLFFEQFPYLALIKTYNTNQQTPDSAGTMSAIMTGIKTKAGVISVDQQVVRGDCASLAGHEAVTALELAEIAGLSTGVVSTARMTHATPAASYAHTVERDFESDQDAHKLSRATGCTDIARQLVELPDRFQPTYPWVNGLEVAMGGGRANFVAESGRRGDRRNLIQSWLKRYEQAVYVSNRSQLDAVDPAEASHVLGLFAPSHMSYALDRSADPENTEPSLAAMTTKALQVLSRNEQGFFLVVESGRIDHAHHETNPRRALDETLELDKAVRAAYEISHLDDTLILVTADHSHAFTIAGYPTRGNPILGQVIGNDASGQARRLPSRAQDGRPYTTLGYQAGPNNDRRTAQQATDAPGFQSAALLPLSRGTHSAEDVALYAAGAGAGRVSGVLEQHAIYHIINRAARLEKRAAQRGWRRTEWRRY